MKAFFTSNSCVKALATMCMLAMSIAASQAQIVYDFKKWAQEAGVSQYTTYKSEEVVAGTDDLLDTNFAPVTLLYMNDLEANGVKLGLDHHFAVSSEIDTGVFYFTNNKNCPGFYAYGSGQPDTYFSITNLKAGDQVRVVYNGQILKYANRNATYIDIDGNLQTIDPDRDWTEIKELVDGSAAVTGTAADGTSEYGTPELTVIEDGRIDFQLTTGSKYHGILRVYIRTVQDEVFAPTAIRATGAYFGQRTLTIDCPNTSTGEVPVILYSTDGNDPLDSDDPLIYDPNDKPVIEQTCLVKAQACNFMTGTFSDIIEQEIEAGTTVSLEPGEWSLGNIVTFIADSATMEAKYYSSVVITDTTQNVVGMPQVYYIIQGDTIQAKWATGNIYSYTYTPTSLEPFEVEIWADGYNSAYMTVDGMNEFSRQTLIDFTTYEPGADLWAKSDLTSEDETVNKSWAEAWGLPEDTEYYYMPESEDEEESATHIAEGVVVGRKNFILAKGIGLIPEGSGSVSFDSEDTDKVVEFSMYNANNLENVSPIWRNATQNYTYTWQASWNMALKAIYVYSQKGSSVEAVSSPIHEVAGHRLQGTFNLQGQRILNSKSSSLNSKGLYIVDGRKVIVR
ncbi:MAG: hypothetical protein IJV45_00280 [Prevotella sp.]|nr:hypothetical protein [Prevotella sp.]